MTRLRLLLALALLGTAVAAYLAYVALDPQVEALCSGVGDCRRVQRSIYADVAGIPVAVLGLGMYAGLLAMLALRVFAPAMLPRPLAVWTFALALAGAGYSAYLTYLELFVIHAICVWCIGSAAIVTTICLLALPDLRAGAGSTRRSAV